MISRHSTLSEKYLRSLPVFGLGFLYTQSKRHLVMAQEEDAAFLSMMSDLGKEPEQRLLHQSVALEKRLIVASFLAITIAWIASLFLLSHLNHLLIIVLAMCNAYCLEWVFLESVTKLSFRAKGGGS